MKKAEKELLTEKTSFDIYPEWKKQLIKYGNEHEMKYAQVVRLAIKQFLSSINS